MRRTLFNTLVSSAALAIVAMFCGVAPAQDFDIVILNGRVMDPETRFDGVRNVGIKDGKIATITDKLISGKETVDAKDHVVAPGFIDTHTHASDKFSIKMSMMDGVTTGLDCELGAINIAAWYEREKGKWPMNYGQCVSQEFARMIVHDGLDLTGPTDTTECFKLRALAAKEDGIEGWSVSVSNLEQINQISQILDENLRQGAIGIGSTIGYAKNGISTYEMFEAQRTAARYGRLTGVHTRFHTSAQLPMEATLGFAEVFTNASLLKAPLLYCHDNDYGWWEIEEKLSMAREMGMNMWGEYYPYAAGSTSIGAEQLKPESVDALGLKYKDIMYDPSQDKYLTREEYMETVKQDSGRTVIVFNPPRTEWMKSWIKLPHMTVGSDAMWSNDPDLGWESDPAKFAGHPRTSGSHSKVLKMGREAKVPLLFTLSQLSYWSAKHLGDAGLKQMQIRGRMQEGMVADIVVFNPQTVAPTSTYKKGEQGLPPLGIPHVIVNGAFVKRDNKATDQFPGQPIRYPVEEKGRFIPASQKQWLKTFTIDSSPLVPKAKSAKEQPKAEKTSSVDSAPDHEPFARPTVASLDPLDPSFLRVDQTLSGEQQWFGDRPYRSLGYCCDFHWQQARLEVTNRVTALPTDN